MIKLREYQKAIVNHVIKTNNTMIVAGMGTGKTLSTLVAVSALFYKDSLQEAPNDKVRNVLVVAPKRVASSVWVQESTNYGIGINIKYCKRALDIKMHLLSSKYKVCVCSATLMNEIPHGCWDMVIVDESTLFKNASSLRSKEARRIMSKVKRRVLLTGTPIHGGYEKLWHQIFLLDAGQALGKNITRFRESFMYVKYNVKGVYSVWEVNPHRIPAIHDAIKHLVYVVKDNVDLPPAVYKDIYVDLPPVRMKEYERFEYESVLAFEAERGDNPFKSAEKLIAFAKSTKGSKLRQLASGYVYTDEKHVSYSITHTEKMDALQELFNIIDAPILVAYSFKSEASEILKAFEGSKLLETDQEFIDWNNKQIPLAIAHPASIGHGLNLQFGGFTVVWFSPTYDAELYSQFNKRLDRPGQIETVSIIHLIASNTIERKILNVLNDKISKTKNFNDYENSDKS